MRIAPVQSGTPAPNRFDVAFHNAAGEEIPASAVVEIDSVTNVGADTLYEVKKPTAGAAGRYLINSPFVVPSGGYGAATNQYPVDAAISGAPAVGGEIGPSAASWLLSGSGSGFTYLGGMAGGIGRVMATGGGSSSPADQRFRLTAERKPVDPVSDSINVEFIDANDVVVATGLVYDEDHRYFGPSGARGTANFASPASNYQIDSMEDYALGARVIIDARFDYDADDDAAAQQYLETWGPPDQQKPPAHPPSGTAAKVYDPDYFVVNAQPDDTVHVYLRELTDGAGERGYHVSSPHYPPQLLWPWSPSSGADENTTVAHSGGVYPAKLIRYLNISPGSSSSYEIVDDAEICFPNGETPTLKHKQRLAGFRIGTATGAGRFAVVAGTGGSGVFTALASSAISAGSPSAPVSGSGTVYRMNEDGTVTNLGVKTIKNHNSHAVKGALSVTRINDDTYLVAGYDLLEALALLAGYTAGSDQIIGHAANGATEWKTLTSDTLNNVTAASLNLDADSLDLAIDYTPVTVKLWPASSDGGGASFSDTVDIDPCQY